MPGDGKQVTGNAVYIQPNLPCCLHGVGVEIDIGFCRYLSDFFDWLDHSGFVVGHHDRDQTRGGTQGSTDIVRVNQASTIHRNIGDFDSGGLQMLAGV